MRFPAPTLTALGLVLGSALLALLLKAPFEAAAVVAVIGVAAVLLQAATTEAPVVRIVESDAPSDEQVGHMLDAVADPLIVVAGGRIAGANSAAQALLGTDLIDRDIRLLLRHPAAADLLRRDSPEAASAMLEGFGGDARHWEMRVSDIAAGRRLIHLVDHSAVRAAERMRVDFVANASHELRTPIAAIGGFAETLADDAAGGDPETRARFLGIISREAKRLQRLVEDLLSLSRIEADRYRTPAETVDLAAIANEAAATAARDHGERGEDVVLDIVPDLRVSGDRPQLLQVVHNLVANALKYGRDDTPVRVTLSAGDGAARLVVADEGEGIAPEHLPRLTERFYRVDAGRSRSLGGTGLGLAIVKHIVERHRGRLEIDSALGRGTTMTVRLPLAAEPLSSRSHRPAAKAAD